jgi:hypothetical protein
VSPSVLENLDVRGALEAELAYRQPYLPASVLPAAIAPRLDEVTELLTGSYRKRVDLQPAEILQVPKRRGGLRPVAVLDFAARVLFRALSTSLAVPLGELDRSWNVKQTFERAPLESRAAYVVVADVANFYDFVDHALLEDEIVAQTGSAETAAAITTFLREVMGREFGLPQVLGPSDSLSEVFIDVAERRMLRAGLSIWRFNDDFRLGASTWRDANRDFEVLDRELRNIGLALNDYKCFILTRARYEEWLDAPNERWETINAEVEIDLRSAGYGGEEGEELEIDDQELLENAAERALAIAVADAREADRLDIEVNRQVAAAALRLLERVESLSALPYIPVLVNREPQFAIDISRYLRAATVFDEEAVAQTCVNLTQDKGVYMSDWQALWLVEAIRAQQMYRDPLGDWMTALVRGDGPDVLRARAALALSEWSAISLETIAELYESVGPATAPDLVAAGSNVADEDDRAFKAIVRDNPFNRWIVDS